MLKVYMITLFIFLTASEGGNMTSNGAPLIYIDSVTESAWTNLSKKKIFFGHQSVGNNIIDGLKDVLRENPAIKLNIVETSDPEMIKLPVFAHYRVGQNQDPLSKNNAFAGFINNGIGGKADFAFFKYCYVDIKKDADVKNIFIDYKKTMESLKKAHPATTFIHVTVPLTVVQTGAKAWLKKIIGGSIGGYDDNVKRNEFNRLLKNEYDSKEPVFDLAKIEATLPDGTELTFKSRGSAFFALVPAYAKDGRHLNEKGRKVIAEQLLVFLAKLAQNDTNNKRKNI